jgi:hypothetical protein
LRKYSRMVSFAGGEVVGRVFVEVKAGEERVWTKSAVQGGSGNSR